MAVHGNRRGKLRQAGRKLLAHVRRGRQAIQRRRTSAGDARDSEVSRLDERLQPLAKHVREGRFFESPWQLVRFRNLQGISDEDAVQTLAAWCKRQGFEMSFVSRQIGSVHIVCLVLKVKPRVTSQGHVRFWTSLVLVFFICCYPLL
jgi:hypothetical protein